MIEVHAEFLLEINLKILLRKTGVRLNLKIELISLHIRLGSICIEICAILKLNLAPVFLSKILRTILSMNSAYLARSNLAPVFLSVKCPD